MSLGFMPPPFIMFSQAANNEIDLSMDIPISRAKTGWQASMNDQTNISLENYYLNCEPQLQEVFKLFLISDWQNGKETIVPKNKFRANLWEKSKELVILWMKHFLLNEPFDLKKSTFTPAKLVSLLELFTLGDSHEILESVHIEVLLVRVRFRVRVMV